MMYIYIQQMQSYNAIVWESSYAVEYLDLVAKRDELHAPPVELEDVQPATCAAGIEDDGVPPRPLHRRRCGRLFSDSGLSTEHGSLGGEKLQEEN